MTSEKTLQAKIQTLCKKSCIMSLKIGAVSTRGVPDLMLLYKGRVIFIEVKTPTGRLSRLQRAQIAKIRAVDVPVYVVDNFETAEAIIRGLIYDADNKKSDP